MPTGAIDAVKSKNALESRRAVKAVRKLFAGSPDFKHRRLRKRGGGGVEEHLCELPVSFGRTGEENIHNVHRMVRCPVWEQSHHTRRTIRMGVRQTA